MDDIVKAALKKWPNVPHCYDWLALDARGDWYLRDEGAQQAGPFPQSRGSRINHDKLKEFIQRNYDVDERGAWFFQNGPQRVYVTLEAAPWVLGLSQQGREFHIDTHTGREVSSVVNCWLDEQGRVFLATDLGLGVVRSMDMLVASEAIEAMGWHPQEVAFDELPLRYGYVLKPAAAPEASA
ncbi:MAG TPA: DUF2946 family protein [Aquabacterium sp.]|uniref:DUF2946 family protein n=1 Tax=Aquabacterium sp. TaxID=1872578 RepID=UPI002E334246|nr:DUF2946 family protein [Aquabacterium sp.]HEX5371359.1 DUF2946 family protein [Aquabacterium sp.]